MSVSSQSTLKKDYLSFEIIESRLVSMLKNILTRQLDKESVEILLGAHGGTTQHQEKYLPFFNTKSPNSGLNQSKNMRFKFV